MISSGRSTPSTLRPFRQSNGMMDGNYNILGKRYIDEENTKEVENKGANALEYGYLMEFDADLLYKCTG